MCSTASILNLCIISVDRYWAISSPFRYERKMIHRVAFVMIGVAWMLSILFSFIPVQLNWHRVGEEEQEVATEEMAAIMAANRKNFTNTSSFNSSDVAAQSCVANLNKTYAISSSFISFYIPVVIMIATYLHPHLPDRSDPDPSDHVFGALIKYGSFVLCCKLKPIVPMSTASNNSPSK